MQAFGFVDCRIVSLCSPGCLKCSMNRLSVCFYWKQFPPSRKTTERLLCETLEIVMAELFSSAEVCLCWVGCGDGLHVLAQKERRTASTGGGVSDNVLIPDSGMTLDWQALDAGREILKKLSAQNMIYMR